MASGVRAEEIQRVAILGAGEMGHGLAELFALRGIEVGLRDIKQEFLDRALERIGWSLGKLQGRGLLGSTEPAQVLHRIHPTTDLGAALTGVQLVLEAVPEDLKLKQKVLAEADRGAPPGAVIASNTSGLRITTLAEATGRPDRVVGMHFFNPPVLMELVEVIRGEGTSQDTFDLAMDLVRRLGKTPVACRRDSPGFITSRIIAHYLNEAARIHQEEGVPRETIDAAMRFRVGFPMGPFELADQVGIDLLTQASRAQGLPVPKPFEEMMAQGRLGRKVGKGFYDYGEGRTPLTPDMAGSFDPLRILAPMVNEAARLVEEGAASPEEIDLAMRLGTAFPLGPLAQGDVWGLDRVLAAVRTSGRFEVSKLLEDKVRKGETGRSAGRGFYGYEVKELEAFETIRLELSGDGRIATVVLNRPDRLNTLTPQMVEELDRAQQKLRGSGDARCLVLRGQGPRAFCAGADITAFMGADRAHKVWAFTKRTQEVFSALEAFPLPTIAAIDGYALGGGCELALACDFRIASKRSTLGQTEVGLGLIPGAGGTQRLVRIMGLGRAKEAVLLAKRYPAAEAQTLGLIHAAVEDDKFEASVAELAGRLAKGPPIALRLAKQLLNAAVSPGAETGLAMEALAFALVTSTEDVMEGLQAFLDKREPKFKGS